MKEKRVRPIQTRYKVDKDQYHVARWMETIDRKIVKPNAGPEETWEMVVSKESKPVPEGGGPATKCTFLRTFKSQH